MNINLQKILFGFLFCLLILFALINNASFQKKIIVNYLTEHQIKKDTYFLIDNFQYNFFSGEFISDVYVVKEKPVLDTIFFFHDLKQN